ncbi:hypothetical protein EKO27_g10500 [Xylaria grammica]|uniref:Uncharacterized protein n=1 Tax=Xylaria grammica TaxID=363999 RepID=A0A439CR22_9PEZI|nr:hypothetical protein EKO27_g10500 [Xylaria grammica]
MHHNRRKSGHASTNSSMTDIRKAGSTTDASRSRRPQTLTRKSTPQSLQKLGKSPRDREREWEEQQWSEDEGQSFPQYWYAPTPFVFFSAYVPLPFVLPEFRMKVASLGATYDTTASSPHQKEPMHIEAPRVMTCEKQFIAQDERFLYCSEACRRHDQNATTSSHSSVRTYGSYSNGSLPFHASGNPEPRDIIPRASPSRPSSNYFSPPTTPTSSQYTSAVSALRSLSLRPPSPPSPVSMNASIWPFTRSAVTSPSSSYTQPHNVYSSTYDGGYQSSTYTYTGSGSGMVTSDRPLPMRNPPAYSRPKSIELVTPMISRY